MNKSVMAAIFAVGLAVVGWVGWGFVGSSPLALAMTVVIAAVYVVGAYELMQFRAATSSLSIALAGLGQISMAQRLNEVTSLAAVLFILWATLRVYRQGYAPAIWYLAGQALLFVAVLAMVLENWQRPTKKKP